MADNMEEELKKMKVPELKQALKDKGLPTSGAKPDLIKRLAESIGASGDNVDPVLDEDEILKDDSTPVVATSPVKSVPTALTEKSETATNGVATENSAPKTNVQMAADTTVPAKPTEITKMTDAERLKLRAEKFGVASEQSKKDLRAQRFGITNNENKSGKISSSEPVDVEKLKKRAERFGVSTSSVTEDEKKRKRAERFNTGSTTSSTSTSISLNSTDSELEAKKRKRAERFGLT